MKFYLEKIKQHAPVYLRTFFKWLIFSLIVGGICGGVGIIFYYAVDYATKTRDNYGWLLYLLPIAGLIIVFLYQITDMGDDSGTNRIINFLQVKGEIPLRLTPLIFISTTLTHLCGGSSGKTGAALQIGGSLGVFLGRKFHLNKQDIHIITTCGMSALFAALFGTPITATIFSLEFIRVGVIHYSAFFPCLTSALIVAKIAVLFHITPMAFQLNFIPELDFLTFIRIIILAIICGIFSIVFCVTMHKTTNLYKKFIKNPYIRVFVGGILVILLTLLVKTNDYNGAGLQIVTKAIAGEAKPEAFLLKLIFTAITLGAGFKGGEIAPTFFVGSTLGCLVGNLLGLDPSFAAAIGLIAMFCGNVNCPIASIMLSIELFGKEGLQIFALISAISYLFSGNFSLYSSQKIVHSKLEYISLKEDT